MYKPFNVPQFEKDFLLSAIHLKGWNLIHEITDTQLKIQRIPENRKKVLQKGPF